MQETRDISIRMLDQFMAPLNWIIGVIDKLLTEETVNDLQRTFLYNILTEAKALRSLLLTIPDATTEAARNLLSFEGRSHLSTIIGYIEELLDEMDGDLTDEQRDLLFEARASSMQLLEIIESLSKE